MNLYTVDIPNSYDPEGAWVGMGEFESREEAIGFARSAFGADEEGRICLVSSFPSDSED